MWACRVLRIALSAWSGIACQCSPHVGDVSFDASAWRWTWLPAMCHAEGIVRASGEVCFVSCEVPVRGMARASDRGRQRVLEACGMGSSVVGCYALLGVVCHVFVLGEVCVVCGLPVS